MERNIIPYPQGLLRLLLRLPIYLHRLGLGRLLGLAPLVVLTTRGRRSGQPRHTVLEYRRHGSKYYVISGWGGRPHWYRNLCAYPEATLQFGAQTLAARGVTVDNPGEVLRVVYMFKRGSPLHDILLASMSSADTIDLQTLTQVADEFTVVRFELLDTGPKLRGVEADRAWLLPAVLAPLALMLLALLLRRRG